MSRLIIEIPDESLAALKCTPEAVGKKLLMASAAKLYELGELSSGAAASLAGLPRAVFLTRLADFGIESFRLDEAHRQKRFSPETLELVRKAREAAEKMKADGFDRAQVAEEIGELIAALKD